MSYCKHCGGQIAAGRAFCTSCGQAVPQPQQKTEESSRANFEETRSATKAKMPKGAIIAGLIILLLGASGFGGYRLISALNGPDKTAEEFIAAIHKKDAKQTAALLNRGQNEMKVDEKSAGAFINYITQHPDLLSAEINSLRDEALAMKDGRIYTGKKDLLSVKETGKKWVLFSSYGIASAPVYIEAVSDLDGTAVSIDGQKQETLKKDKPRTFGPFLPNEHTVNAEYKGKFATVKKSIDLDPAQSDEKKLEAAFAMSSSQVYVTSNEEDATLFVNGKNSGVKVRDAATFGPIASDGTMKLHAEKDGRKSNEFTITAEGEQADLSFPEETPVNAGDSTYTDGGDIAYSDQQAVVDTLYNHYQNISYGRYEEAYNLFSSRYQSKNKLAGWKDGVEVNSTNTLSGVNVDNLSGDTATVSFTLTSEDGNGEVRTFAGKWHMIRENGEWKMNDPEIKQI